MSTGVGQRENNSLNIIVQKELLAESVSIQSLAKKLNVANSTIRNNLNYHKGTVIKINGENVPILIRQEGVALDYRDKKILTSKDKWPMVTLPNRLLSELKGGLTYVIDPNTGLDAFEPFESRIDLFASLYPKEYLLIRSSQLGEEEGLKKLKFKIGNLISKNINIAVQGPNGPGVRTEVGNFWFCCNPEQPYKHSLKPVSLYVVSKTGELK